MKPKRKHRLPEPSFGVIDEGSIIEWVKSYIEEKKLFWGLTISVAMQRYRDMGKTRTRYQLGYFEPTDSDLPSARWQGGRFWTRQSSVLKDIKCMLARGTDIDKLGESGLIVRITLEELSPKYCGGYRVLDSSDLRYSDFQDNKMRLETIIHLGSMIDY